MTRSKFERQRVIAVDVDDTLIVGGKPNSVLVAWLENRKAEGFSLMLWSMRGQAHAQRAVNLLGICDLFDVITSKPGYVVDDQGWNWIKFTHVVRQDAIARSVAASVGRQ